MSDASREDGARPAFQRPPWPSFRAALERAHFRPSRRLGQNFLLDENMCRALARDAGVGPGDFVLEVGAGCGFLTAHLAETGARVLSVEVDPRLFELASGLVGAMEGVELLHADALASKHRLAPELERRLPAEGEWWVVANLPYVISAPLLAVLSELANPPTRMNVLVQREVAERIVAAPGSGERGPLSVKLQSGYRVELGRVLGPKLFWPRPKVESATVLLERRPDAPSPEGRAALDELARALFQRRRQGVGRVLGEALGDRDAARALLERVGIEPLRRPDSLAQSELLALAASPEWAARGRGSSPDSIPTEA